MYEAMDTIPLPYVEGLRQPTKETISEYDDSVDVYVEQSADKVRAANLRLCPAGPCEFVLMGFSTDGLRQLARLLDKAADDIDTYEG